MTDWQRLEKDFKEIEDPFKGMRADWSDQPELRNQWRIAAGLDGFARSRFETLVRLAGKSLLRSTYAISKCSTDLRAIQDDMVRWFTGVRELTGKFEVGPIGTLLDSDEAPVGTLCTGSINRVIDASALLCLQLAAEETETSSIASDKDRGEHININVTQKAKEIKNTVGAATDFGAVKGNRSFFMNPWVVGIGVTVIGGILLYIITATFPKQKTIVKKTPEQRIEKTDVTQRGGDLTSVTGAEISNKRNLPSTQQHETANTVVNRTKLSRITPEELDSFISTVSDYRTRLQLVRDSMNKQGTQVTQEDLSGFRIEYEKHIRPLADALDMNEPGEKDFYGYILRYDNPADLAMKEFSFFHVNLSLGFLSGLIGRLEYLRDNSGGANENVRPLSLPTPVTIASDEIALSGPGTYLVDTENKADSDALRKIYGLSEGDEVTLRAADNNRTIVITRGHYLIMPANFSLNNEDDSVAFRAKGYNICAEVHRQNTGD
jgi:hypothetical protein